MGQAVAGGCLCGAVRFTAVPEKPEMGVCHCGMCRRWSGGAFMAVSCTDLALDDGAPVSFFASSEWGERGFCATCGTSLFWRMRAGQGEHVAVSFQSFDDLAPFTFSEEIFIDEKPPHYDFAGDRPRRTGAEIIAAFQAGQAD